MISKRKLARYFDIAKKQSLKSNMRCKVGAIVVTDSGVFTGHNYYKTHPLFTTGMVVSIHAEMDCFRRIQEKRRGSILVTYRETRKHIPSMSRPCKKCMEFLKILDPKQIYYSFDEKNFGLITKNKEELISWNRIKGK